MRKHDRTPARIINFFGLRIAIENEKGSIRHWHDPNTGMEGDTKMHHPYGYFLEDDVKRGEDGDGLDVFVGPDIDNYANEIYVIKQRQAPDFEKWDETKVMIGFESPRSAVAAYQTHFDDPRFLGKMKVMSIQDFKDKYGKEKTEKALNSAPMIAGSSAMMMKPPDDPDIPEAVPYMLGRIAKMGDTDLMELSAKVWGPGYRYNQQNPILMKEELIGFLLDQKEMFDLVNKLFPIEQQPAQSQTANQMQPGQQQQAQPEVSSDSSQTSEPGPNQEGELSKEANSFAGAPT